MKSWNHLEAEKYYHVQKWGQGYFNINKNGNLAATPDKNHHQIDITEIVKEMKMQGVSFPAVIRFHDILRSQVKNLNETFKRVIDESNYQGRYFGVYPIKVNQMREVVEEIIEAGAAFDYGLEAGSKSELLAVLAYNTNKNSLTIINGYKDEDYLRLALLGSKLGRQVIIVVEKYSELPKILKLSQEMKVKPIIGIRAKMSVEGKGRWAHSSGEKAKFGLSISEILKAVHLLDEYGLKESLKLFHFHMGSQITDILTLKDAINEGGRIYAKLHKLGCNLEYFDAGGGLAVDYDGTQSTNDSSTNYSVDEYVRDLVFNLKQICDMENVPHPNIVTESGRAVTAHHSCVITNVIDQIKTTHTDFNTKKINGEHFLVSNIRALFEEKLEESSLQTIFNEAYQLKEECLNAFKLGVLDLEERAKVETLYWKIATSIKEKIKSINSFPEELSNLEDKLAPHYLCNFSVFQSAADCWAIDQILPVIPISRLNERPTVMATLADITCDSDGKIDYFVNRDGVNRTVPLHEIGKDEEYLIGLFMTGAYQDVMGDMHNLFGRLNEVHVYSDETDPQGFYIEEIIRGNTASGVLATMQYNPDYMAQKLKHLVSAEVSKKLLSPREGVKLVDFYEDCLRNYTYLNMDPDSQSKSFNAIYPSFH